MLISLPNLHNIASVKVRARFEPAVNVRVSPYWVYKYTFTDEKGDSITLTVFTKGDKQITYQVEGEVGCQRTTS